MKKTAEEIVALIHKELKIPGVSVEVLDIATLVGMQRRCQAASLRGVFNLTWKGSSIIYGNSTI